MKTKTNKVKPGLIFAVFLIVLGCGLGWFLWDSGTEKFPVDGNIRSTSLVHAPIDKNESVIMVQEFCNGEYDHQNVEDLGRYWIIPLTSPDSSSHFAKITKLDGNLSCKTRIIKKEIFIDSTTEIAKFLVSWLHKEGDVDLILRRPDSGIIDEEFAAGNENIYCVKERAYELYKINQPMRGEWIMYMIELEGVEYELDIDLERYGGYMDTFHYKNITSTTSYLETKDRWKKYGQGTYSDPMMEGNVSSNVYFDKEKPLVGEPVRFIVAVGEGGEPITNAVVDVIIESPTGTNRQSLSLYDTGEYWDGMALDGIYANWYINTDVPGTYQVYLQITGNNSQGESFTMLGLKTLDILNKTQKKISISPKRWYAEIQLNETSHFDLIKPFLINSTSEDNETMVITFTDFKDDGDDGNIVKLNLYAAPNLFVVPAGESGVMHGRIQIPEGVGCGVYTGHMILMSTSDYLSVPITLDISAGNIPNTNAG